MTLREATLVASLLGRLPIIIDGSKAINTGKSNNFYVITLNA